MGFRRNWAFQQLLQQTRDAVAFLILGNSITGAIGRYAYRIWGPCFAIEPDQ